MDPIPRLRAILDGAGYRAETIAQRLRVDPTLRLRAADAPVHLRRLRGDDAVDTLIRLFLLHTPVRYKQAEPVLATAGLSALEEVGVIEQAGDWVRSPLTILPHAGLLFAYDHHEAAELRDDSVLGLTSSARTLAAMTVRKPVARALDVGTGCGVQALLAAGHAGHVVAVDINARALWLTDLNCRLNGITNVECRHGDLFQPVRGETFDLVVSNPPFVISPVSEYMFRDSGFEGDTLSKTAVRGAAEVLADGGFATVMCNWISRDDEPWWTPLSQWVDGCGCDALLIHYETLDPLSYAAAWNEYGEGDRERLGAALDCWLAYYSERHIGAIGIGAVILRRTTASRPWVRPVKLGRGPSGSASEHVQRIFAAEPPVPGPGEHDVLLDQRFAGVDGHRLDQVLSFRDGRYTAEDAVIVLDDGLGLQNSVPVPALHVLLRLDGRQTVRELVAEIADETGLDVEMLAATAVECLGQLYVLGLVRRVAEP